MTSSLPDINFDEFYKREGNIWLVKRFQSKLLSALLRDLKTHCEEGISDATCSGVKEALVRSITMITDIKDHTFFFRLLFQDYEVQVKRFHDIYTSWNDASTSKDRIRLRDQLVVIREDLGKEITSKMRDIRTRKDDERKKHFESLKNVDRRKINALRKVFHEFVQDNGALFPELSKEVHAVDLSSDE